VKRFNVRGTGRGISEYALDLMGEMPQNPDIMIRKEGKDVLVIDAKYKQLQTDESNRTEIITSDVRQVWSYCLTPKQKLPFGVIVYPKHELIGRFKERYSMKRGVTIVLKAIDLAKATIEGFLQECDKFAVEIENLIEEEAAPKILARHQK
jgi:5-methylcytosine-specific restriction endonuclease McrBC regulatory subunit McrC